MKIMTKFVKKFLSPWGRITLKNAKKKFPEMNYALVNPRSGEVAWLCATLEVAKETLKDNHRMDYDPLMIVKLEK